MIRYFFAVINIFVLPSISVLIYILISNDIKIKKCIFEYIKSVVCCFFIIQIINWLFNYLVGLKINYYDLEYTILTFVFSICIPNVQFSEKPKLKKIYKETGIPKTKRIGEIICLVFTSLIFTLAYLVFIIGKWTKFTFNCDIENILFTLKNPIEGTNTDVIGDAFDYCLPRVCVFLFLIFLVNYFILKRKYIIKWKFKVKKSTISISHGFFTKAIALVLSVVGLSMSVSIVDEDFKISEFLKARAQLSTIYEDYYVDPLSVAMSIDGSKPKNVIQIYIESMETTYASTDVGGKQTTNYIPHLTNLAQTNVSFSSGEKLGGFLTTSGTSWTMGALMAFTSGVPYSFPIEGNFMSSRTAFASKLNTLGELLQKYNYRQYFQCGSDAVFGGRADYFMQHGDYQILDLQYARDCGYIPSDYHEWWGYEDKYLYEIAKTELLKISATDQPFNYTMLTVDTHATDGYICDLCDDKYDSVTANVVSCADLQVYNFIEWCKQQDFYEDTVIVLVGDHPRMDNGLVDGVEDGDRKMYNCFINCSTPAEFKTKNRITTAMDMFPTIVYAMGFRWSENRLGIGTNLFSNEKTLAELMSFEVLSKELQKASLFYENNFY